MSENLIVKIKKANEDSWYSKHIGESFCVEDFDATRYIVINPSRKAKKRTSMLIKKIDCRETVIASNSILELQSKVKSIKVGKKPQEEAKEEEFHDSLRINEVINEQIISAFGRNVTGKELYKSFARRVVRAYNEKHNIITILADNNVSEHEKEKLKKAFEKMNSSSYSIINFVDEDKEKYKKLLERVYTIFNPNIDSRLEQDQEDLLEEIKKALNK